MSWSINARAKSAELDDALIAAFEEHAKRIPVADETRHQFEVARNCALNIAWYGAVGDATKNLIVTLSGHANPDHEPASGYANDQITVSVLQGND